MATQTEDRSSDDGKSCIDGELFLVERSHAPIAESECPGYLSHSSSSAACASIIKTTFDFSDEASAPKPLYVDEKKSPNNHPILRVVSVTQQPSPETNVEKSLGEMREWSEHCSEKFEGLDQNDIGIIFKKGCYSRSAIGTNLSKCKRKPNMWRMNIRMIFHEIGHALGLVHKHQNPEGKIQWDIKKKNIEEIPINTGVSEEDIMHLPDDLDDPWNQHDDVQAFQQQFNSLNSDVKKTSPTFSRTNNIPKVHRTSTCLLLLLIGLVAPVLLQELESTQPAGQNACSGEKITFTCVTRGSASLAWTSDQYIGGGGRQLVFLLIDTPGTTQQSSINPNTTAILLKVMNSGEIILQSQLNITVSDRFATASVSCLTANAVSRNTTSFSTLLGGPGVPQDVAAAEIPSEGEMCVLLVEWDPPVDSNPEDILHYIVQTNGLDHLRSTETFTLATFLIPRCLPDLQISVFAVDRCGRKGPSSAKITPRLLPDNDTDGANTTLVTTQMELPDAENIGSNNAVVIVGVMLSTIIIILMVMMLYIIVMFFMRRKYKAHAIANAPGRIDTDGSEATDYYGSDMESIRKQLVKMDKDLTAKDQQISEVTVKLTKLEKIVSDSNQRTDIRVSST